MTDVLSRRAHPVFIPLRTVRAGPPWPFDKWSAGAHLHWLRSMGFDAEEVVNWIKSRPPPFPIPFPMHPFAPEPGYWLYYYGAEPTKAALRKSLQ